MDIPLSYQYFPTVPLSDLSDLYSTGDIRLNNRKTCIVSYLPKILRLGPYFNTVKNRYILFIADTPSVDSIAWSIQFFNRGEPFDDAGLEVEGEDSNDFLVLMNENLFDSASNLLYDRLIISCEIVSGAEKKRLTVEHILVSMHEIKPGFFGNFCISNSTSSNYLFNCLNDYLSTPDLTWNKTEILTDTPDEKVNLQKIAASAMYYYIFHYGKESEGVIDITRFANENIKAHLNSVPPVDYDGGFRNGICYVPLYLLNDIFNDVKQIPDFKNIADNDKVYELLKDPTLVNLSKRADLDDNVPDLMNEKVIESKRRLYEDKQKLREFFILTFFPKSCVKLCIILIKYLFECSKKNSCNECIRKDPAWVNVGIGQIADYEIFFKNVLTHFFLAPAGKIAKLIKPARKTWKYFGSNYIDMIVNNFPRIVTAYFAKKRVILANNMLTCQFERLDSKQVRLGNDGLPLPTQPRFDSVLGRQIYLVIETLNCRDKQVVCNVRPSANTLTGNTNDLDLVLGCTSWNAAAPNDPIFNNGTDFIAQVGNLEILKDIRDTHQHYVNVHEDSDHSKYHVDHVDKAIIKLQLRPQSRASFDTWANNMGNGTVDLEILVQVPAAITKLYGNDPALVAGPGEFLNDKDEYIQDARFRMVNKIAYEVFHSDNAYNFLYAGAGTRMQMGIIQNESASNLIKYFYHDHYDNEHEINDSNWTGAETQILRFQINEKGPRQNVVPNLAARGALLGTIDLMPFRNAGEQIDATLLTLYANGTWAQGNAKGNNGNRWYPNTGNMVYMISGDLRLDPGMGHQDFIALEYKDTRNGYELTILYLFEDTRRRSVNPDVFAGIIGALAKLNLTPDPRPNPGNVHYSQLQIISEGFAYEDGSCYPSTMHRNGEAFDTHYNDPPRVVQQTFINLMHELDFRRNIVGSANSGHTGYANAVADNGGFGGIHDTHMHSDTFNHNRVQVINL